MKEKIDKVIVDSFYIGLITIFIFVLMELGVRIFFNSSPDKPTTRADMIAYSYFNWRDAYFRDLRKPHVTGNVLLYEPFSLWKHDDKKTETINIKNGYRVTWLPEKNIDKEDYVIFVLGGSTIFCAEVPDEFTIPSMISKQLNTAKSQCRYVVGNYSAQGFINDNEIHLLVDLLRKGERPNMVIFYDGVNDITNKVARGMPHYHYPLFNSIVTKYSIREFCGKLVSRSKLISLFLKNPNEDYIRHYRK